MLVPDLGAGLLFGAHSFVEIRVRWRNHWEGYRFQQTLLLFGVRIAGTRA